MQLESLRDDWPALDRLLDEALALASSERPAWLAQVTAGDRRRGLLLGRLLEIEQGLDGTPFLEAPPPMAPAAPAPGAGQRIGPYRLLRQIGQGGMGTVWLAAQVDGRLNRQVALKLPRLAWDDGTAARMARERDILATLEHPNIARLYDAGTDAAGRPWLALEYVAGLPIDQHCRDRALGLRARVALLRDVAGAVAHAHALGIVHRDLKPSNLLVGADGRVRLLDFGIARLLDAGQDTAVTGIAGRAMTIDYASPEQLRGEAVGPASDVYSLGVIAYELLAGERPYRLRPGSGADLEAALAATVIAPPSRIVADRGLARALRGDLDAIVTAAMRPAAAGRTASADLLAADLQRYLDGLPVLARPERVRDRVARQWRRWRRPAAGLAVLTGAFAIGVGLGPTALLVSSLTAGLAATGWQARRARRQAQRALAEARRADAVQTLLTELLGAAGVAAESAEVRARLTVGQWLDRAATRLQARPAPEAAVQEAMLALVGRLLHELGAYARAAALRQDLRSRLGARGAAAVERARAARACAESLQRAERPAEARAALAGALDALQAEPAAGEAGVERALIGARIGLLALEDGRLDEAAAAIEPALAVHEHHPAAVRAELLGTLAALRGEQGRLDEARALYDDAIRADEAAGQGVHAEAIERRRRLSSLLVANAHYADGERVCRRALEAIESAGGSRHPATVALLGDLSRLLTVVGRGDEARAALQRALAAVEADPPAFAPLTRPRLEMRLGELLLDDGRIEEAGPWIASAAEAVCAGADAEATVSMVLRARWLVEIGRFEEALHWLRRAHDWRRDAFGPRHEYTLSALNRIAVALTAAGDHAQAAAVLDALLGDGAEDAAADPARPLGLALLNRVQLQLEAGDAAAAVGPALAMLERLLARPAPDRARMLEAALRLRAARALLGSGRPGEALPQLQAIDGLLQPLFEHAPLRIHAELTWAELLLARGERAAALERLARAHAALAAQPSLGPQYRRRADAVALALGAAAARP